jgi:hypothetical protein
MPSEPQRQHRFAVLCLHGLAALACLPLLLSCGLWPRIHPDFVQTFIDVQRNGDDRATTAVFDPELRVLAIGRDSGRLELWDAREPGARRTHEAFTARLEHIAFGPQDGIVLGNGLSIEPPHADTPGTRIWDARSGELLHTLKGTWSPGPIAASPVRGLYLIGDASELLIYDHTKRAVVGDRLKMARDGQVTAIGVDRASGQIAVGTSRGDLLLLRLQAGGHNAPRLETVRQATPQNQAPRSDVLTLMFLDDGRRLVSAARLPPAPDREQRAEVVAWDTATLQRQRSYPITLQTLHQASHTAGEPWLVLAGTVPPNRGKIELVDLRSGVAWRYNANTSHPAAVLLPEIRAGLILQSRGATRIRYLEEEGRWREKNAAETHPPAVTR